MWPVPSVVIYFVLFLCFTGASHTSKRNILRFRCDDNNIIKAELICNGHPDCADASDETLQVCQRIVCDDGYKKCAYGACVKDLNCCFNEKPSQQLNVKMETLSCTINNIPRNGFAWIANSTNRLKINDAVDDFTQITYTCIEHHYIIGDSTNLCHNGEWTKTMPTCEPRCSSSAISSITFLASCYTKTNDHEYEVRCTEAAIPGTIARINCKWGYQNSNAQVQILTCDDDGRWFPIPNQCTQICGEEAAEGTSFIVGGQKADIKKVPWHVGIYKRRSTRTKSEYIVCGGTIVSPKVIVSAAHCFWDPIKNKLYPESEYRVVAGKYYRDLNDPRESNAYQSLGVKNVYHVSGYNDYEGLFANDIVVVVLNNYIEFKLHVAPVCIEEYKFDEKIVPPGSIGRIAGWGLVRSDGLLSDILKQIDLPVIQREQCLSTFDQNFHAFFTSDKFCAGHLTGDGVCSGDSGGGFVFPKLVNGKTIYYLRGIVSTGENRGGTCEYKYSLFTNTAHFWDLIQRSRNPQFHPQILSSVLRSKKRI